MAELARDQDHLPAVMRLVRERFHSQLAGSDQPVKAKEAPPKPVVKETPVTPTPVTETAAKPSRTQSASPNESTITTACNPVSRKITPSIR